MLVMERQEVMVEVEGAAARAMMAHSARAALAALD